MNLKVIVEELLINEMVILNTFLNSDDMDFHDYDEDFHFLKINSRYSKLNIRNVKIQNVITGQQTFISIRYLEDVTITVDVVLLDNFYIEGSNFNSHFRLLDYNGI